MQALPFGDATINTPDAKILGRTLLRLGVDTVIDFASVSISPTTHSMPGSGHAAVSPHLSRRNGSASLAIDNG